MVATTHSTQGARRERGVRIGVSVPIDAIDGPGAYVCNWSGHLLRVRAALPPMRGLPFNIVGSEPLFVTRISENPEVDVQRARFLARGLTLSIDF